MLGPILDNFKPLFIRLHIRKRIIYATTPASGFPTSSWSIVTIYSHLQKLWERGRIWTRQGRSCSHNLVRVFAVVIPVVVAWAFVTTTAVVVTARPSARELAITLWLPDPDPSTLPFSLRSQTPLDGTNGSNPGGYLLRRLNESRRRSARLGK